MWYIEGSWVYISKGHNLEKLVCKPFEVGGYYYYNQIQSKPPSKYSKRFKREWVRTSTMMITTEQISRACRPHPPHIQRQLIL